MAFRKKDRRLHTSKSPTSHLHYSDSHEVIENHFSASNSPPRSYSKRDNNASTYLTGLPEIVSSPGRFVKRHDKFDLKTKPQTIIISCSKHTDEIIKFIDLSTQALGVHCEICLVDEDQYMKQGKVERIIDVQEKVRTSLVNHIEKLKELDRKIDEISKNVNVGNALIGPIMTKIADMERKAYHELEFVFKRLRDKFTTYNPFSDTKLFIRDKLETSISLVHNLDSQGYLALQALRTFLKSQSYWKEDNKMFFMDLQNRLEIFHSTSHAGDKELGKVMNAFDQFLDNLRKSCDKWLKVILSEPK